MNSTNPIARTNNIVVQRLENETLIYDLSNNTAFCLNETAARVWAECNGNKNASQITDAVNLKFNTDADVAIVEFALDQLERSKLLDLTGTQIVFFKNKSRREIIKQVGFASIVALPLVTSIVAPRAIHAQSCAVPGGGAPGDQFLVCSHAIGDSVCQDFCAAGPAGGGANCCSGAATLGTCVPRAGSPGTEDCNCVCS